MSCLVTALFYDSGDMQRAIEALVARGIPPGDLSLMVSRSTAKRYFAPAARAVEDDEGGEINGPFAELAANLVAASSGNAAVLATGPLMTARPAVPMSCRPPSRSALAIDDDRGLGSRDPGRDGNLA